MLLLVRSYHRRQSWGGRGSRPQGFGQWVVKYYFYMLLCYRAQHVRSKVVRNRIICPVIAVNGKLYMGKWKF